MDEITQAENTGTAPETITTEPSQDPIQQELAKEKGKTAGKTEAEKATFALQMNAKKAAELGVDVSEVLGIKPQPMAPAGDTVVTVAMLEEIEKGKAQKTALTLADEIADEHERELTKIYLQTRIVPSGNASEDLRLAQTLVNSVKTRQTLEEQARAGQPRTHVSGAGAPARLTPKEPELTAAEQQLLNAKGMDGKPLLTKEEILAGRTQ